MTNARRPYVKLHVCLILNQTLQKKKKMPWPCENLQIIGNTWFCPAAPLFPVKDSLLAAYVSKFSNIYCKMFFYCVNLS